MATSGAAVCTLCLIIYYIIIGIGAMVVSSSCPFFSPESSSSSCMAKQIVIFVFAFWMCGVGLVIVTVQHIKKILQKCGIIAIPEQGKETDKPELSETETSKYSIEKDDTPSKDNASQPNKDGVSDGAGILTKTKASTETKASNGIKITIE